jgi:GTPase
LSFRSGFIAIAGRPNVGKSTLLNRILGEKVAIVSPRPQTTRSAIRGILTADDYQLVFVDTPGMHKPVTLLGERLNDLVRDTVRDVDAVLVVFDASRPIGQGDAFVAREALGTGIPAYAAVNKMDIAGPARMIPALEAVAALGDWREIVPISAVKGDGVDTLRDLLVATLSEGPMFYPDAEVTDVPLETRISELIREKALYLAREELPHSIAVTITEMTRREDGICEIEATIYVERDSQKPIVIGKGGAGLKEIGTKARKEIQPIVGSKVFLRLRVAVAKGWQGDPRALNRMGF